MVLRLFSSSRLVLKFCRRNESTSSLRFTIPGLSDFEQSYVERQVEEVSNTDIVDTMDESRVLASKIIRDYRYQVVDNQKTNLRQKRESKMKPWGRLNNKSLKTSV